MPVRKPDDVSAAFAAIVLLALAAFIALWIHPDPRGQATWFFALLPGAYAAPAFLDVEWRLFHRAGPEVMWATVMLFSFVWYFIVAYAVVKVYRLAKSRTQDRIRLPRL
jgi:hypothetical protein